MENVTILGDGQAPLITKSFLRAIAAFAPSARRLALALASVAPWRNALDELPDCYRREFDKALYDAREERSERQHQVASSTTSNDFSAPYYGLEDLFRTNDQPISPVFLKQVANKTPSTRRACFALAMTFPWWGNPETCPESLRQEWEYATAESQEETEKWQDAGWVERLGG